MEEPSVSSEVDADIEEPLIDIPVLERITRKERIEPDRATFIRDFAYSADNPLFWRLDDQSAPSERSSVDGESFTGSSHAGEIHEPEEGSGFTGAPPWLQSTTNDGGLMEEDFTSQALDDELHGRAVALFEFAPEHENEFPLTEGQIMYISSRHGLGWLVAVDLKSGDCGLVPEEYVRLLEEDEEGYIDDNEMMNSNASHESSKRQSARLHEPLGEESTDDWVDEPDMDHVEENLETVQKSPTTHASASTQELTDEEGQKILDAAEREMALVDAKLREDM